MGYFDGLTNASFKKDQNGNTVFFPWGVFGRGRLIVDPSREKQIRHFLSDYYQAVLFAMIGFGVLIGWLWTLLVVPVFTAWFCVQSKKLVAGCPFSEDKLTLKEGYAHSAAGHSKSNLWIMFICSLLFVAVGIWMATGSSAAKEELLGWVTAIFFGACSVAIGYMLKKKYA